MVTAIWFFVMAQKPTSQTKESAEKNVPLKARKVLTSTSRVPFLDADEFVRRRQTGPLSRYVE